MFENEPNGMSFFLVARLSLMAIGIIVLNVAAQESPDSPSAPVPAAIRTPAIQSDLNSSFFASADARDSRQSSEPAVTEASNTFSNEEQQAGTSRVRRITLQLVQQSANRLASPVARLGQLSVEAAKQHRLGVEADYFPKFGATFANLHYSEFLGQLVTVRRPFAGGSLIQVPVPIFSQNQTIAVLTFTQPITPLFEVRQAVRIARADERIARAKAGVMVSKNARNTELEETYFKLLIAHRRPMCASSTQRASEGRPRYARAFIEPARAEVQEPQVVEAEVCENTAADAKELTVSLNRAMGWPDDIELELVPPDPLVENVSLDDIADKAVAANPDVIVAEQNAVKARAASAISKMAYFPVVAAVGGYMFQNAIPAVPSNFGYGGVIASWNLFDFGKRERAVKEARAQLEMAELAVQLTKAKAAADVKKSYLELQRSRQLSKVALRMGSSMAVVMKASTGPDSSEVKAARVEVEAEMLDADLAHRQAFSRLMALTNPQR
jgi:hypothetical protein